MTLKIPKALAEYAAGAVENPKLFEHFAAEGLEELVIDLTTIGSFAIFFDATDEATLMVDGDDEMMPHLIERAGHQLIVEGRNLHVESISGQRQRLVIEAHVPASTRITAEFTAGLLILGGGTGDLDIHGQFGEIAGITHAQNASVRMECGAITLNELAGSADIHLSMGGVKLGWEALTGSEQISVECGMGGVDLLLPPGAAPRQERGGFNPRTRVRTVQGSSIDARVGMGGLDVRDWSRR